MHTLLQKLDIEPPYIIAGASMGGIYIKHFAQLYPDEVEGVVFVDPLAWDEEKLRAPKYHQAVLRQSKKTSRNEISAMRAFLQHCGDDKIEIDPAALGHVNESISTSILNIWEILDNFIYIVQAQLELERIGK